MVCTRLGFHCRVNGMSWRGATGRMIVWVWAAVRDGISKIQSMSGWSAQRMDARSVSASSTVGGAMPAVSGAWRWARAQAGNSASGGDAQHVVGEFGQRDQVAAGQAMAWAQADQQRFGAEHLGGDPGRFGDRAAGQGHVDVAGSDGVEEVGQPHPLQFDSYLWCFGGEQIDQVRGEHGGGGRGDAQPHGACLAVGDAAGGGLGGGDLVENDRRAGEQFGTALVRATRRVVRVNSGVPSSRSRRRISSLSVGAARCSRSAARPKCSSVATATNASS
jgi:hypothetical protein